MTSEILRKIHSVLNTNRGIIKALPALIDTKDHAPILHLIADAGRVDMLFAVLQLRDANMINAKDKDGKTPLAYLCSSIRDYYRLQPIIDENSIMFKLLADT